MSGTIENGDMVYINKLSYGPNLPRSGYEIPWINLLWYINKNTRKDFGKEVWPYYRLSGYSKIKQNDLMVFKSPWDINFFIIKRCIGMPGDTLEIVDGKTFCSGKYIKPHSKSKSSKNIYYKQYIRARKLLDSLGIEHYFQQEEGNSQFFVADLTSGQSEKLKKNKATDLIIPRINEYDSTLNLFPHCDKLKWSIDNYGPIFIPEKGAEIELNDLNFAIYKDIIKNFEKTEIVQKDSLYFLNGKRIEKFKFSNNYFFMMGDNRHQSQDSRFWGFVPESRIIGKATMVLWSKGNDGFRWDRFFKLID